MIRKVLEKEKDAFNQAVDHPIQTWEWGEFKEKTGMKAIRLASFKQGKIVKGYQVLLRSLPKIPFQAGHLLKSSFPDKNLVDALKELSQEENLVFLKLEPDYIVRKWENKKGKIDKLIKEERIDLEKLGLQPARRELFDPHSFVMDLNQTGEELLANMHSKTRYNIRLAEKKGVTVEEKSDTEGLEIFIQLFQETLKRQNFYMHSPQYFRQLWQTLQPTGIPHILLAKYQEKILNAWMIFVWKNRLFYPYGASSNQYRELMASNLICWETIKFGQAKGCQFFDMWGAGQGPDPDPQHPWYGFYRFKLGYGGDLVRFAGSWDLVANPWLYEGVQAANKLRWKLLRLKAKLSF
jgi:lipid II:glycine glycyltransferase (peptidoglycan interpeptide bridge formation enzyme)